MSRPRIEWDGPARNDPYFSFYVNYIAANVRAMSGAAVEKFPQTNDTILQSAFSYRLIPEVAAYVPFDTRLIQASLPVITNVVVPPDFLSGTRTPFDPGLPDVDIATINNSPHFLRIRLPGRLTGGELIGTRSESTAESWVLPTPTPTICA